MGKNIKAASFALNQERDRESAHHHSMLEPLLCHTFSADLESKHSHPIKSTMLFVNNTAAPAQNTDTSAQ
jgi:hypothetical protein